MAEFPTPREGILVTHFAVSSDVGCRRGRADSLGLLDQNGTGIEQIEALTLRVLLGLRPWLGDDDGDVAARRGGVGEPGRQQRGLHTPAAVRGRGGRTGKLRHTLRHPEAGATGRTPSRSAT